MNIILGIVAMFASVALGVLTIYLQLLGYPILAVLGVIVMFGTLAILVLLPYRK